MEEIGNGGMSDAEGDGYECAMNFQDEINAAQCECTNHDSNTIASHAVLNDNNVFICLGSVDKDEEPSCSLYSAAVFLLSQSQCLLRMMVQFAFGCMI